jgi:transcriptional regulator GlxA family with amidase domain
MNMKKAPLKIALLAFDSCTSSMLFGTLDILSFANANWKNFSKKGNEKLFDITIVSHDGQPVYSFSNYPITVHKSSRVMLRYDLIYIPGFLNDVDIVLKQESKNIAWLKKQYEAGTRLAAACNGNFLLAATGLLSGKRVTTHWSLKEEFKKRYQSVILQPEKILIDEGSIISAAGVTAYQNLALHIVKMYGSPELASFCAKVFLLDSGRRIQTPYQVYNLPKSHGDRTIVQVQEWLEANFMEQVSTESIMQQGRLGQRTLSRRFKKATGDTPLVYLQRLRIENAKRLLESTGDTFNEITWKVGYADASSFQKLFKSSTGLSPGEYRQKFSMI